VRQSALALALAASAAQARAEPADRDTGGPNITANVMGSGSDIERVARVDEKSNARSTTRRRAARTASGQPREQDRERIQHRLVGEAGALAECDPTAWPADRDRGKQVPGPGQAPVTAPCRPNASMDSRLQ
jgi:hypothetical protein